MSPPPPLLFWVSARMCAPIQVRDLAKSFLRELGRHTYVTPTSYLELIQTFKDLLQTRRTSVSGAVMCV